ncbi:MAG: DUF4332 domain-containing protein [Chloroflexota bacterium]
MGYYMDAENMSLSALQQRIESTDLVPSRVSLLQGIGATMAALAQHGMNTTADLRTALKTNKRLEAVAQATGISADYLVLLRREVESYFPKPFPLKEFTWLPGEDIARLEANGVGQTAVFYQICHDPERMAELENAAQVDAATLETLTHLCGLTRVQWVSPMFARMLLEAGYDSAAAVAAADAEALHAALLQINEGDRYFKGKIGLRDIKRLIHAAGYVADSR